MQAGVFTCRRCRRTLSVSQRWPRYAACRACVNERSRELRRAARVERAPERRAAAAARALQALRFRGECMVCGSREHAPECGAARVLADLAQLGWLVRPRLTA